MNGSECDPLTQRREVQCELPDSRLLLNKITNDRLSRALDEANQKRTCDRKDLERILLKYLGNASVGGIEIPIGPHEFEINRGKAKYIREGIRRQSICSLGIKKRESIFKDLTVRESAATFVSLGALVRIDNLAISSDKFTHFFAQGHDYLEVYRSKGSVCAALRWGKETELGRKGMESTGVMSYGDLCANYAGLNFWLALTDPLDGHIAYCNGKWIQTRCFDWAAYITPGWDEGINVPCYKPGAIRHKIQSRIGQLVAEGAIPHCPPLDRHRLEDLTKFYEPELLPWLINPISLAYVAPSMNANLSMERETELMGASD